MFRMAAEGDLPRAAALWQRVFGDDEAYIMMCLRQFAGPGGVFVAQAGNDAIEAILSAVPCRLGECNGVYLYALATEPESRGKGTMTGLMEYAHEVKKDEGATFSVLIPASPSLFGYYRQRGYTGEVCLRHLELELPQEDSGACRPAGVEDLEQLRERFLDGDYFRFPNAQATVVKQDLEAAGLSLVESREGYAAYLKGSGHTLLVPELAAASDAAALALLAGAGQMTGCSVANITLPQGSPLFGGMGEVHPTAQVKWLDDSAKVKDCYLRFALDDIEESFSMWRRPALS